MGRSQRQRLKLKRNRPPIRLGVEFKHVFQWLTENGWRPVAPLCPAVFPDTGRGIMAMKTILPDELLVQIPGHLLISKQTVQREIPAVTRLSMSSAEALAIYLMFCKTNTHKSVYLSTLPLLSDFSNAALCTEREMDLLLSSLPTSMAHQIQINSDYLFRKFQRIKSIWEDMFCTVPPLDIVKWAWFSVSSRAVYVPPCGNEERDAKNSLTQENNMALAPFLDLLNHHSEAEIEAGLNPVSNCYEIRTRKKIRKFEQVFINYGPHGNLKLFIEYGFIVPRNLHSVVEFDLSYILKVFDSSTNTGPIKLGLLNQLSQNKTFFCSRDGFSYDTLLALSILCSDDVHLMSIKYPYQVNASHSELKGMELRLANELVLLMDVAFARLHTLIGRTRSASPSFKVANSLIRDQQYILQCAILKINT